MTWVMAIPLASKIVPKNIIPDIIIELEIIPPYKGILPFTSAKNNLNNVYNFIILLKIYWNYNWSNYNSYKNKNK